MQFSQLHYLPIAPLFFAVLIGIFFLVLLLIQLGILRYAYMQLGVSSTGAFMLLAGSLLGSYFNFPVWHLPAETVPRLGRSSSSECATWCLRWCNGPAQSLL